MIITAVLVSAVSFSSCGSTETKPEEPVKAAAAEEPVVRQADNISGKFFTGWENTPKGWRYFDRNGEQLKDAWLEDGKMQWYYFDHDGYMLHDTVTPDGYYVGPDGKMEDPALDDSSAAAAETAAAETAAYRPFYGIWCDASKDYDEACRFCKKTAGWGFPAEVFVTTDWDNLNPEKWYAVTAGVYYNKAEAESVLPAVKQLYPDAYVKYSGNHRD